MGKRDSNIKNRETEMRKKGSKGIRDLSKLLYFATNNAFSTVRYDRCYLLDDHSPDIRAKEMFL